MKQCYLPKTFSSKTLALIDIVNSIVREYQAQGFILTVRQLYYQLVARDIIPNTLQEYKRAASIINDGKLAGLIDWDAIEDRTRAFVRRAKWSSGASILRSCVNSFYMDMWANQNCRVFVIVEKEALVGVLERICSEFDIPLLAARGYPSGTVLREFALSDLIEAGYHGQRAIVLHLGDHDPSGMDMTRDMQERLSLFSKTDVELHRIALNMDQIEEQRPPENPAKTTDSRFDGYRRIYGESSWELDALSPTYLADLVRSHVEPNIDYSAWTATQDRIDNTRNKIATLAQQWTDD